MGTTLIRSGIHQTGNTQRVDFKHVEERPAYPIIVHSHLGWDWVWQRPQQFLSRLSKRHRILFVEGPLIATHRNTSAISVREVSDYPNIVILQTEIPEALWKNGAVVDAERRRLVQSVLAGPLGRDFVDPVQWFYDPMAVTAFAGKMDEIAIVYDCMDELSKFRGANPELVKRERELLTIADVVFAGGPKIGRAKSKINTNCFSYGCGVDRKHFAKASDPNTPVAGDVAHLPHPIFGYMGVVDERTDYDLAAKLADATPHGSVVFVGPWTKVDRAQFPERPNLHWLGGRDYGDLPSYLKAFDVCLMPFALNEATEYINPTKALEYMATEKPVVSMPVEDVVLQFSEVVNIAKSQDEFIAMCHRAAAKPNRAQIARGLQLVRKNSWEAIVRKLEQHIEDALDAKRDVAISAA